MEPIIGDTRFTEGNIEMFTESGWVEVTDSSRANPFPYEIDIHAHLFVITRNNLREHHNINISKDRLLEYIINNPHPRTSYGLRFGNQHDMDILEAEQTQIRHYIQDLFINLNAYCKLSNRPKLGGMVNNGFYRYHKSDIPYKQKPSLANMSERELIGANPFRRELMLDINPPEDDWEL